MARGMTNWICAILFSATSSSLGEPPQFTITDLGTLGGSTSTATAINDEGQVAGWSTQSGSSSELGFFWSPETGIVNLGGSSTARTLAYAINNTGEVTGQSWKNGSSHWFKWAEATGLLTFSHPAGMSEGAAYAINNQDIIGGYYYAGSDWTRAKAYHRTGGLWQPLGTLGGINSVVWGLNDTGQSIGYSATAAGPTHAFLWEDGQMTDIGASGPFTHTVARDISETGEIIGWGGPQINGDGFAVRWVNGTPVSLGTLGGSMSEARGVNVRGQTVGFSTVASGQKHAFLVHDDAMYDLNDLLVENTGWILREALDINEAGSIVGSGLINGQQHAFLLNEVPEPATGCILLAAALAALRPRR